MSTPEHRRGAGTRVDPRLLLVLVFLLGVVLTAAVAGLLASRSGDGRAQVADSSSPAPSPGGATPPASGQPSPPSVGENEQRALMTKPLAQLALGDRVVYNMKACRFRAWVGKGQDVALIACAGGGPFQVRTEYLVPVELGGD